MRNLFLIYMIVSTTACSSAPATDADTGVEGSVSIGPMCPETIDKKTCLDRPYHATFIVVKASGDKVTQFSTDNNGKYHIILPPGNYVLHPVLSNSILFADERSFSVRAGQFTRLDITFDSGIR